MHRIVFDNTLSQQEAVELVKTGEGRVDVVTELSPLETLRVAESPFAKVVKNRGSFTTVFGLFNMRKAGSPWRDVRLRQAMNGVRPTRHARYRHTWVQAEDQPIDQSSRQQDCSHVFRESRVAPRA